MTESRPVGRGKLLTEGVLVYLCLGLMYSWSKFSVAIRLELRFDQAQITFAYTICMGMFTVGIFLDGALSERMSPRECALLGTLLCSGGYLATARLPAALGPMIYLTYGVPIGLGVGFLYNVWLSNIVAWFRDKRGFATGILLLGMGLSGVTTTPLMAEVAQAFGWRRSFAAIGLLLLGVGLATRRCLRPVPKEVARRQRVEAQDVGTNLDCRRMLRQPCFWSFCVWKLLLVGIGQALLGQVAVVAVDLGGSERIQLAAVSIFVLCNGLSRILWGGFCDRLGILPTMVVIAGVGAASQMLLTAFLGTGLLGGALPAMFLTAFSYGGATTIGANYIHSVFGGTYYRQNNGVSALTCLPANLSATALAGVVHRATGSYFLFAVAMIPAALMALALGILSGPLLNRYRSPAGGNTCEGYGGSEARRPRGLPRGRRFAFPAVRFVKNEEKSQFF